jgi:hypothetical protein
MSAHNQQHLRLTTTIPQSCTSAHVQQHVRLTTTARKPTLTGINLSPAEVRYPNVIRYRLVATSLIFPFNISRISMMIFLRLACPPMSNNAYTPGQLFASLLLLAPVCLRRQGSDTLVSFAITQFAPGHFSKVIFRYNVGYG